MFDHRLVEHAYHGRTAQVASLLALGADPTTEDNAAIRYACRDGHSGVFKLLLTDGRAMTLATPALLIDAVQSGSTEIVNLLLRDRRINPADIDSLALRTAATRGVHEIVLALLIDGRANPAARDNEALRSAVERGFMPIVQLLLSDARVDSRASQLYELASHLGRDDIARVLLSAAIR